MTTVAFFPLSNPPPVVVVSVVAVGVSEVAVGVSEVAVGVSEVAVGVSATNRKIGHAIN